MQHQNKAVLKVAACSHLKHRFLRHRALISGGLVMIHVLSLANLSNVVYVRLKVEHAEQ